MASKVIPVTSSSIRYKRASDGKYFVAGKTDWIAGGWTKGEYVAFLRASLDSADWADVVKVTAARLVLYTPADAKHAFADLGSPTNQTKVVLTVLEQGMPDNSSAGFDNDFSGDATPRKGDLSKNATIDNDVDDPNSIDIRQFIRYWAPAKVKIEIGDNVYKGQGHSNHGLQISVPDRDQVFVVAAEGHPDTFDQPSIHLTYVSTPQPGVLFLTGPPTSITQVEDTFFEADYIPGSAGDHINWVQIQVYLASTASSGYDNEGTRTKWMYNAAASASETETNHMREPLPTTPGLLKSGTDYVWRARVRNQDGEWTSWTGTSALLIATNNPTLSTLLPDGTSSYDTLNHVTFEATYLDTNTPKLDLLRYRIQLASPRAHNDAAWDVDLDVLWDTQDLGATAPEITASHIKLPYGGDGLQAGTYSWRMRATNALGGDSPWTYPTNDLIIDVGEQPDPGDEDLLTGYSRRTTRARIVIRDMRAPGGTLYSNRRPGRVVAVIEDATNVGASEMHNAPGEFFFTLPAIYPQVGAIEPWQVHYSLQMYRGEGWKEITAGLITDYDATDNDVVFYGTDYLGLLELDIDDRFNTDKNIDRKANLYEHDTAPGGSKYVDNTITEIVKDQLDRAIHHTGSPVGFITRGSVAAMNEKLEIFSTFKSRLSFIAGLIDSHRGANLGLRTRIRVRKTTAAGYQFVVDDQPGKDRDNIRLEYGGLVQGFRIIPFGDWGTRVFAIGRAFNAQKVEYYSDIMGVVPEATFGRLPKVNLWQDITDKADLKRRAQLYARQVSKVGKRMALAIRVDSIDVKDGWDIADSVKVAIDRGVVNTDNFGSGYWTIWGWSWQLYPDGHTDLTLSLSPRLDSEPPSTDLVESDPIHSTPEWAIGSGPPNATTFALFATETWVDSDTGQVYAYDSATETWAPTEEILQGPEGPPGPPGPEGPPGTGGGTSDTIPPDIPTIKSTASQTDTQDDGTALTSLAAVIGYAAPPGGLVDLAEIAMQSTRFGLSSDPTQPDWTLATQWVTPSADATGTLDTNVIQPVVHSATDYWLRAAAVDQAGNRSDWSAVSTVTTASDTEGPPQPTGLVLSPGMNVFAVQWDAIEVADLDYVEVQWRVSGSSDAWASIENRGTMIVVTGVQNDVAYDVRVRSVDTSGNTTKDDGTTVPAVADDEAGWVEGAAPVTPSALPGNAFIWDAAIIEDIFAGNINADWITAGTLKVGVGATTADAITVYNAAGQLVGRWTPAGIEIYDPANPGYKMVITAAGLTIYTGADTGSPVAVVTMSPLGIDAASITFGSARGGHNLILNSSFELGAFVASTLVNSIWDLAADWNAAGSRQGADINITTGATALTMTAV